jgi:hypothetical protein
MSTILDSGEPDLKGEQCVDGGFVISIVVAAGVAGCATPITNLKNPTTGEVVKCGGGYAGSAAGGLVGYAIEMNGDDQCVAKYKSAGFIPFYPGYDTAPTPSTPSPKPAS